MGGNVFNNLVITVPLTQTEIVPTYRQFVDFLRLENTDIIGSCRSTLVKKTNDLDIATTLSAAELIDLQQKLGDLPNRFIAGTNILSVAFPKYNRLGITSDMVQIDLMHVSSLDWARWYFAAGVNYPNIYRILLMADICRAIKQTIDVPSQIRRWVITPNKGIEHRWYDRKTDKLIKVGESSNNPQAVSDLLFGYENQFRTLTFEQCYYILESTDWQYEHVLPELKKLYKETLGKNSLEIPSVINHW